MEAVVAITLIVGNLVAIILHIAASERSYADNGQKFLLSICGLFFSIGAVIAVVAFGVPSVTLGLLLWFSAIGSMVFFLIGPMEASSGQG